ncbi:Nucleolar protein 14 [Linum perenne]
MAAKTQNKAHKNGSDKKNKNKKKSKKTGPAAVAMKQKATVADNPFETIWSSRKFDVLGKKRKGEERRVGFSRSKGIEKRKNTLLKDYQRSAKSSVFVDNRIGEGNAELGEFDKAVMRSQKEHKMKLGKKSKFNLLDGEEEEEDEFGSSSLGPFAGRDDFDNEMPFDDEDDGEQDGGKRKSGILRHLNSPDMAGDDNDEAQEHAHKSKKEVMQEIIMKSKHFKAEKAKEKEENEKLMEELDQKFTSLEKSKVILSLMESANMDAAKPAVTLNLNKNEVTNDKLPTAKKLETPSQEQPDSYEKLLSEMVFDIRARPSERTKTPEEIAEDERERLERLEEERQKRMVAAKDSSDEDDSDTERPLNKRHRTVSGDDLGDSFSVPEPGTRKGWVDEILEREEAEESEDEENDDSEGSKSGEDEDEGSEEESEEDITNGKVQSLKDWEHSDDENLDTDLEEDDDGDEKEVTELIDQKRSKKNVATEVGKMDKETQLAKKSKTVSDRRSMESDLPFLIEAPKTMEELSALVETRSNADIIVIINRIRASNAIKLAAENRKKMQMFYGILLQYFAVLANKKPLNFELLNLLVKPLMELSVEIPYFSAICARQRILKTRSQFCESMKSQEKSCWPSIKTLSLLRLWSMIFPCSDFRHVVMTPAMLLICEYLMRAPISSGHDIAVGSFLCSMVLSVTRDTKKFCPEALIFLRTLLMAASQRLPAAHEESQFHPIRELKELRPLISIRDEVQEISPLNILEVMDMPEDDSFFSSDSFRASVLMISTENLRGFVEMYGNLSSFPEIFLPISTLLLGLAEEANIPPELQDKFRDVALLINQKADEHHLLRRPLQMRKQKPVPIKLYNPKFEETFVKGRDYDPDRERADRKKMKKLLKQEAKGAARELRKDNHFLLGVKEKERAARDEERKEAHGRAKAFLQEQEHAFKSGQLGKGKGTKRRR